MTKAAILLADGFEEIEVTVPFDLLTEAGIHTDLVSVQNKDEAAGTEGMTVKADAHIDSYDFSEAKALIVPGGPGYAIIQKSEEARKQAEAFLNNPGKVLGGICAGSALLGMWGLLKGKNFVCVPDMKAPDDFGGHFEMRYAVIDNNLVTGISVGGAFEFGFDLVKVIEGSEKALALKEDTYWDLPHNLQNPIYHRRSIRSFTDEKPDYSVIEEILQAAMAAPSAVNARPWEFYVTDDQELMEKLAGVSPYAAPAKKAPWLIIPCYHKNCTAPEYIDIDSALACENLMLEADAKGLGTVMLGVAPDAGRMEYIKNILNLDDDLECFTLIPVGYPKKEPAFRQTFEPQRIHRI